MLEALKSSTELSSEVQLKVLQALPALVQNYADSLRGSLLSSALEVCASLQNAKLHSVASVAAATMQQLTTNVFEKVGKEDRRAAEVKAVHEVPYHEGTIKLRPAAFDAYRVFADLALAAQYRTTDFVSLGALTQDSVLELVRSCIHGNSQLFDSHPELNDILGTGILPIVTAALSESRSFSFTVVSLRILDFVLSRHFKNFPAACSNAFELIANAVSSLETPMWKRATALEVLRNFFSDSTRVVDAYALFDMAENTIPSMRNIMSAFVRLSAEKPSVIGLGQQSTVPAGPMHARDGDDQEMIVDATTLGGVAGFVSSALGVMGADVAGLGSRWSVPRVACLEQLDKVEPPTVPETYIYFLVLQCLASLSEGLARIVVPLTLNSDKATTDSRTQHNGDQPASQQAAHTQTVHLPWLKQESGESPARAPAAHGFVENCWPAFLATCSTYLNAALDDQLYRNLVKTYQRFAQVAGLLRLSTARDALITTLGKSAVPPHVLSSALSEPPKTPLGESSSVYSNSKGLLSVDSFASQASTVSSERERKSSYEPTKPMLTNRNLLCLRALLNLAIALGPALDTAFAVVVDVLRQADTVLSTTTPQQMIRQGLGTLHKRSDAPDVVQAFSSEIAAVEAAASRLLEGTADYSDDAFVNVLDTFCRVLHGRDLGVTPASTFDPKSPSPMPTSISRTFSGLTGISTLTTMKLLDYTFVLPKISSLAELNVSRFASGQPSQTGWDQLVTEMVALASSSTVPKEARRAAAGIACKVAARTIAAVIDAEHEKRVEVQRRSISILTRLIVGLYDESGAELTSGDLEVQSQVVKALQALLQGHGNSLVAGWNRIVVILSSVFERTGKSPARADDEQALIDWEQISKDLLSVELGRIAFATAQLVCSDFLSAVPRTAIPALIELLYRFVGQTEDLNMSLTAITMLWNISDLLSSSVAESDLEAVANFLKEADDVHEEVVVRARTCTASQWLLVLFQLQRLISVGHIEVRRACLQTICSIFKNNGSQLGSATWDLTLRSIILRIAVQDISLYHNEETSSDLKPLSGPDVKLSREIVNGIADILSLHLRSIEDISRLPSLWEALLNRFEAYLDLAKFILNAAVYGALALVLSRIDADSKLWSGSMYRTLHLWMKQKPTPNGSDHTESNQESFITYVEAGAELYRLTQQSMSVSQTRTFTENMYLVVQHSNGPQHGADINSLSPLQTKVLAILKATQSDSPSVLVTIAAKLIVLPRASTGPEASKTRPTFIALAKETIDWAEQLVIRHASEDDLIESGALTIILHNLRLLIEQKYTSSMNRSSLPLWQKATNTAVTLSSSARERCRDPEIDPTFKASIWTELVEIARAIIKAEGVETVEDHTQLSQDQNFDIESFKTLRAVLIPGLNDGDLPDDLRLTYVKALFDASIIHPLEEAEFLEPGASPLVNILSIRRGRVKRVPFSRRERMCYVCLGELLKLTSQDDESTVDMMKLASAAAPSLILRLAIPIRAYIADQPLRGARPQPLSELEELLYCFRTIKELKCAPGALRTESQPVAPAGEKAHLRYLYPLLVKAVKTAGDKWSGAEEVLGPLQELLAAIDPFG